MKLKKLEIELKWYGDYAGQYVGKLELESPEGSVAMILPPAVSNLVLAALGDNLAKITKDTAENLASTIRRSIEETRNPALQMPPDSAAKS